MTDLLPVYWDASAVLLHLSAAKCLQKQLPEMLLLTFDNRLQKAAQGEGLVDV